MPSRGCAATVEIDPLKHENIRPLPPRMTATAARHPAGPSTAQKIPQQHTGPLAGQIGIESWASRTVVAHPRQGGGQQQNEARDQAGSLPSCPSGRESDAPRRSWINVRDPRAMARPRMNMLSGRNIHSAIPRTIA